MTDIIALPYAMDALTPYISSETVCFIHQKIMPELASFITLPKETSLMDYLAQNPEDSISYRCATELYNHSFWLSHLNPTATPIAMPRPLLMEAILHSFGSLQKLHSLMHDHAKHPDTRWLWLACQSNNPNKLSVVATCHQALDKSLYPLAACNLWQHAYYLDYRHRKHDYLDAYLQHLIHWHAAETAWTDNQRWSYI